MLIAMNVCVKVLFEAQNCRCSLSDMILSARDRLMILMSVCSDPIVGSAEFIHCSLSDMILSARDRLMIANECLQ